MSESSSRQFEAEILILLIWRSNISASFKTNITRIDNMFKTKRGLTDDRVNIIEFSGCNAATLSLFYVLSQTILVLKYSILYFFKQPYLRDFPLIDITGE